MPDRPREDRMGSLGGRTKTLVYDSQVGRTVRRVFTLRALLVVPTVCVRTYTSIDPAPPTSGLLAGKPAPQEASEENIAKLRDTLNDKNLPLFERYRAMFALRNIGTPAAVDALASGFNDDSALFKYVPSSKPYLFLPPDILRVSMRLPSCSASSSPPTPSPLY